MRRYNLDLNCLNLKERTIFLQKDHFHHICEVCKNKKTDKFEVLIKEKAYLVEIIQIIKKTALAKILEEREVIKLKKPFLHLFLAMPKFSVFESILEKSIEMGVSEIHLLATENSFIKTESKISLAKKQRWQKIISSAMGQSNRANSLKLQPLKNIKTALQELKIQKTPSLVAYVQSKQKFSVAMENITDLNYSKIAIFIGPEGGFSKKDAQLFKDYKIQDFSLGNQILKVETACLFSLSLVKYKIQAM